LSLLGDIEAVWSDFQQSPYGGSIAKRYSHNDRKPFETDEEAKVNAMIRKARYRNDFANLERSRC